MLGFPSSCFEGRRLSNPQTEQRKPQVLFQNQTFSMISISLQAAPEKHREPQFPAAAGETPGGRSQRGRQEGARLSLR